MGRFFCVELDELGVGYFSELLIGVDARGARLGSHLIRFAQAR